MRIQNPSPCSQERGDTVLEALVYCVLLLPGKKNTAILFCFLQTLSPYFYLASEDWEPRFQQQEQVPDLREEGCLLGEGRPNGAHWTQMLSYLPARQPSWLQGLVTPLSSCRKQLQPAILVPGDYTIPYDHTIFILYKF